ncbi:hypothetical protein IFM89_039027 [Coptis chinensis]|uniref:Uncharacterized protein n=1 Tax=Coptis chinensis TaxID=261450 RepID=A0A835M3K7_9MAGN|nr:hypothetical protein IFM89_039027 [Coptis chinensis]
MKIENSIMSGVKSINRRTRGKESEVFKSVKKRKVVKSEEDEEEEFSDPDYSNHLKGIISALNNFKEKNTERELKKHEVTISSASADIKSMFEDAKAKIEKERQSFVKALSKNSKECESTVKSEVAKYQALHEKLCKENASQLQRLKDLFSKYDEEEKRLFSRHEQQRKKEKTLLIELEKACAEKVSAAEDSLKKKKKGDKCFNMLRKSLDSFLDCGSDEDFPADE